jgi:hypothetical protein
LVAQYFWRRSIATSLKAIEPVAPGMITNWQQTEGSLHPHAVADTHLRQTYPKLLN